MNKLIFSALVLVLLAACKHAGVRNVEPALRLPLSQVTGAVQYAIDKVAKDESLWVSSSEEFKHLSEECDLQSKNADAACIVFTSDVTARCRAQCIGACTPADDKICESLLSGSVLNAECWKTDGPDRPGWCAPFEGKGAAAYCASRSPSDAMTRLCNAATECLPSRDLAASACGKAAKAKVPHVISATLELEVLDSVKTGGGFTVVIFSASASRLVGQTQTQKIVLSPRPALTAGDYKLTEPPVEALTALDPDAVTLGESLYVPLREAIASVTSERADIEQAHGKDVVVKRWQNPMLLKEATITLLLEAGSEQSLGFATELSNPVIKVNAEGGSTSKRANTIEITFAQPSE